MTARAPIGPVPGRNQQGWDIAVADRINGLINGKMNIADNTTVTLRANETTTVLTDSHIGPSSHISLEPLTASAATAKAALWYEAAEGLATLNHASDAADDQTFSYCVLG